LALAVAVVTYVSLVVGELVPKQIALRAPETIAARVAPAMTLIARVSSPLVSLLDATSGLMLRTLGHHSQPTSSVTDEEIRALVAEAERAGVIERGERIMIAGVMRSAIVRYARLGHTAASST
jgi:putative hemolysin